jgi:hypothetical protein
MRFFLLIFQLFLIFVFSINDQFEYRWIGGDNTYDSPSVFGTTGVFDPANKPSARRSCTMSEHDDSLFIYGGAEHLFGILNDLWEFDLGIKQFRYVNGNKTGDRITVYPPMKSVYYSFFYLGCRLYHSSLIKDGSLFVFGGLGTKPSIGQSYFADIWEYNISSSMIRWVAGNNNSETYGVYSTNYDSANRIGNRFSSVMVLHNNSFFIFGGYGYLESGSETALNDFWEYDYLDTKQFRWIGGEKTTGNVYSVYGTKNVYHADNMPGSLYFSTAVTYEDSMIIFGGNGYTESPNPVSYTDTMWEYSFTLKQWRWIAGDSDISDTIYRGTAYHYSEFNNPGPRMGHHASLYKDQFILFGGRRLTSPNYGVVSDVWQFDLTIKQWRWVGIQYVANQAGVYGTKDVYDEDNHPPSTGFGAVTVHDNSLYMFAGSVELSVNGPFQNNLWEFSFDYICYGVSSTLGSVCSGNGVCNYTDSCVCNSGYEGVNCNITTCDKEFDPQGQFRWIAGVDDFNVAAVYGVKGVYNSANNPGTGYYSKSFLHEYDNTIVFFGGNRFHTVFYDRTNSVWKFDISTRLYKWIGGNSEPNKAGVYGTKNVYSISNYPSSRHDHSTILFNDNSLIVFAGLSLYNSTFFLTNDVWEFDLSKLQFRWLGGLQTTDNTGVYGTKYVYNAAYYPGSRNFFHSLLYENSMISFGGDGYSSSGPLCLLNDMWQFDLITLQFRWIGGLSDGNNNGVYGTKKTYDSANYPGSRKEYTMFLFNNTIIIFGGSGYASVGVEGFLNDVWQFDLISFEFRWIAGSDIINQNAVFGETKLYDESNIPDSKKIHHNILYKDTMIMFGGYNLALGYFNNIWQFDLTLLQFRILHFSNPDVNGIYGSKNVYDIQNLPGTRIGDSVVRYRDSMFIIGGYGHKSTGTTTDFLNDVWEYTLPIDCFGSNKDVDCVCSGHGKCLGDDVCCCEAGWTGSDCSLVDLFCDGIIANNDSYVCSGHGDCLSTDSCVCSATYYGDNCEFLNSSITCDEIQFNHYGACSGHGECIAQDTCVCQTGYTGQFCQYFVCNSIAETNPSVCGGEGLCIAPDVCTCNATHAGQFCQYDTCFTISSNDDSVCSGHGSCDDYDNCTCNLYYNGTQCSEWSCHSYHKDNINVCSGHGTCISHNNCQCTSEYYSGMNCDVFYNATQVCEYKTPILHYSLFPVSGSGACDVLDYSNWDLINYFLSSSGDSDCKEPTSDNVVYNTAVKQRLIDFNVTDVFSLAFQLRHNILESESTPSLGTPIFTLTLYNYELELFHSATTVFEYTLKFVIRMRYDVSCLSTVQFEVYYTNDEAKNKKDDLYVYIVKDNSTHYLYINGILYDMSSILNTPLVYDCIFPNDRLNIKVFFHQGPDPDPDDPDINGEYRLKIFGFNVWNRALTSEDFDYIHGTRLATSTIPFYLYSMPVHQCYGELCGSEYACFGHGKCTDNNVCECAPCYSGNQCSTYDPNCDRFNCFGYYENDHENVCSANGDCIADNTCSCDAGYNGVQCESVQCSPVCSSHGTCTDPNICTCDSGWVGKSCNIAYCFPYCNENQFCDSNSTHVFCSCETGWSGGDCMTPLCVTNICGVNEECVAPELCKCESGWAGDNCTIPVCDPICGLHQSCNNSRICECDEGWNGVGGNCLSPICSSCLVHQDCAAPETCVCEDGWGGVNCTVPVCDPACGLHQNCNDSRVCVCDNGWTGVDCLTAICDEPDCNENQDCIKPDNCVCKNGWTGDNCTVAVCSSCDPLYGTCYSPSNCSCNVGYNDTYGDTSSCDPVCSSCGVNEYCSAPEVCSCLPGYSGSPCALICPSPCGDNQHCVLINGTFTCECLGGYYNNGTGVQDCYPGCQPACDTNEECVMPNVCACKSGYSGSSCDPVCSSCDTLKEDCTAPETCTCKTGLWVGTNCSVPVCDPVCGTNQKCVDPAICECDEGWSSYPSCDVALCSSPSCSVNEECVSPDICKCVTGFYKNVDKCEKIYYCQSIPSYNETVCNAHGDCDGTESCDCDVGYVGTYCDVVNCDPTCIHGTCSEPNTCTCDAGWEGDACDVPNCDPLCTNHQYCDNSNASNVHCECDPGWMNYPLCDTPICGSPLCNSTTEDCIAPNTCKCKDDYYYSTENLKCELIYYCNQTGSNDPIVCSGHGDCIGDNVCTCDFGYGGSQCSGYSCTPTCKNGGTCVGPNTCSCLPGWSGEDCSIISCTPDCIYGNCTGANTCTCSDGYSGSVCTIPVCDDPVCGAHGTCVLPNVCNCDDDYFWNTNTTTCEKIYRCYGTVSTDDTVCSSHGDCTSDNACSCDYGYSGSLCDTVVCSPTCSSHGTCTDPNICTCDSGWVGKICDIVYCFPYCNENQFCDFNSTHVYCSCETGWGGSDCMTPLCETNICGVNEECVAPETCRCETGWAGNNCTIPICDPVCGLHQICNNSRICECDEGWSGDCLTPICSSCLTHQECAAPETCVCEDGWSGENCTIPVCDPVCGLHQNCNDSRVCVCDNGWSGVDCLTPICDSPTCNDNQDCIKPDTCVCKNGWTGDNCSIAICSSCDPLYGNCTAPETCECQTGYNDTYGDTSSCDPICSSCGVNEYCSAPEVCSCMPGYSGSPCALICPSACGDNQHCVLINGTFTCECLGGYFNNGTGIQDCYPGCQPACDTNEECVSPNVCACKSGYSGPSCDPVCSSCDTLKEDCTAPETCTCKPGLWAGTNCSVPICDPVCGTNQKCVDPAICECDDGWSSYPSCDVALCTSPSCSVNEECVSPDVCRCVTGFYKNVDKCEKIYYCQSIPSYNETVCNAHGDCDGTESCDCNVGYVGTYCDIVNCDPICIHGTCSEPNTCTCDAGWQGDSCNVPKCNDPVCGVHQYCDGSNSTNVHCACDNGWTGTVCEIPVCTPACNSTVEECVAPNDCRCKDDYFYSSKISECKKIYYCNQTSSNDQTVCSGHGDCIAEDTCYCDDGYIGSICTEFTCDPLCLNGGICSGPNTCNCSVGWTGDDCNIPECTNCKNGNCTSPGVCTCDGGWSDTNCDVPICDSPVCGSNSVCISPNVCRGNDGYFYNADTLQFEKVYKCFNISATNPSVCSSNGHCIGTDVCLCGEGYSGTKCLTPVYGCTEGCVNGNCTGNNICDCNEGWTGHDCNTPICTTNCKYGNCTAPDNCTCQDDWTGSDCSTPLCTPACGTYGTCVNKSPGINECCCNEGYYGETCQNTNTTTVCIVNGMYIPWLIPPLCTDIYNCFGIPGNVPGSCGWVTDSKKKKGTPTGVCVGENQCACFDGFSGSRCRKRA